MQHTAPRKAHKHTIEQWGFVALLLRSSIKPIDEDKSKGVHNFPYAQKLMSEAEEKVLTTRKSLSKWVE